MKQTVLLIYALIVIIVHTSSRRISTKDDISAAPFLHWEMKEMEKMSNLSETEIQSCIDKVHLVFINMLKASDFIMDDEPIINESVVKFGCFIACMVSHQHNINPNKFTQLFNGEVTNIRRIDTGDPLLDCIRQVRGSNECEIGYEIVLCEKRQLLGPLRTNYVQ